MARLLKTSRFLSGVLKIKRLWAFHISHKMATKSPNSAHDILFLASMKQSSGHRKREVHASGLSSLPFQTLAASGQSNRACMSDSSGCPQIVHCIVKPGTLLAIFPHEGRMPLQRRHAKSLIRGGTSRAQIERHS